MWKALIHVVVLVGLLQMLIMAVRRGRVDFLFGSYARASEPISFWIGWLFLAAVTFGMVLVVWDDWL
jgi:hypothetical protein